MKIRIIIISILLFISNFISAQEVLNQYLKTAATNNSALKAKFNEYLASLEKIPQVGALPDPQLTFGYFIMPVETKNGPQQAKISLTQMFPWFGTLNTKENISINNAKAKYEEFKDYKSAIFFEIKSTYYKLYFINKSIDITIKNIQILETLKSLALIKIEAGKSSGVDLLRVEMELADLENNLSILRDNRTVNSVKFNKLLNIDRNSKIEIPDTLWTEDLVLSPQFVLDSLKLNNHQIQKFDYLSKSFEHKEQLAKINGKPNIFFGADYTAIGNNEISDGSGNDALFVKIGISIPLYRKKYSAMIKEAVLLQQSVEDKKNDKLNTLEILFEKAYSEYTDANRRIILFKKQSRLAEKAIKILESEYASNGKNFEEILRMDKSLLKYELKLEKAYADKQAAIAFINYLTGK